MFRLFFVVCLFYFNAFSIGHALPNPTIKEIFTKELARPINLEPSFKRSNPRLMNELINICENLNVTHVLDLGCGDPNWLQLTECPFNYIGVDIVDSVAELNRLKYGNEKAAFQCLDITQEQITYEGEGLALCRNCLQYFSYFDIFHSLEQLKKSNTLYLLASTDPYLKENTETSTGIKRKVNLQSYPFFFPEPIKIIAEDGEVGSYLGLWRLKDLDLSKFYQTAFQPLTILSKPVGQPLNWEHSGVMGSIRRGLPQIHRDFNINTDSMNSIKPNVVVVTDIKAGVQAYEWKMNQNINTLLVGPNIVSNPTEGNSFITWPLIDAFLSPSNWPAENLVRFNHLLEGRTRIWFTGVNENYWKPDLTFSQKNTKQVLIYRKTHHELSDQVEKILLDEGFSVWSIKYGSYSEEFFKSLLSHCLFSVFISYSESQGIALAEAWSMDVPTLVWNPKENLSYGGYVWENTSSCPYLNPMVGKEWNTLDEFKLLLDHFNTDSSKFQPRRWTLLHMTDKISIERLMCIVREMNLKNAQIQETKSS